MYLYVGNISVRTLYFHRADGACAPDLLMVNSIMPQGRWIVKKMVEKRAGHSIMDESVCAQNRIDEGGNEHDSDYWSHG